MGKGHKGRLVASAGDEKKAEKEKEKDESTMKGCNSPAGCKRGEDPPLDCSKIPGYVKVICNNQKCTRNQYLHPKCYDQWETMIIAEIHKVRSRRDYTDEQVRRRMWTRQCWDLAFPFRKCPCGGHLLPAEYAEITQQPQAAAAAAVGRQRNGPKNGKHAGPKEQSKPTTGPKSRQLPSLARPGYTYTKNPTVPTWLAAGGRYHKKSTPQAGWHDEEEDSDDDDGGRKPSDNYIPGLVMEKKTANPKGQRQPSPPRSAGLWEKIPSLLSLPIHPPTIHPPTIHSPPDDEVWNFGWGPGGYVRFAKETKSDDEWDVDYDRTSLIAESDGGDGDQENIGYNLKTKLGDYGDQDDGYDLTSKSDHDYSYNLEDHMQLTATGGRSIYDHAVVDMESLLNEISVWDQ